MASPRPLPLPSSTSSSGQDPSQARGGGLQYENSFAFQPGIVWLLKLLGRRSFDRDGIDWNPSQAVILTSVVASVLSILQPVLLNSLTIRLTGDRRHSKLAAYLSILSLSPCSLITPTPESFFSFFALLGHLCLSSPRPSRIIWTFIGAFCYCIATAFRANGVLLAGFILWTLFWKEPSPPRQLSLFCAPILVLICIWPLILTQAFAFSRFCLVKGEGRKWCNDTLPNVYAYVQSHYWDVGLFRYWTFAQIPNWILALPALSLASHFAWFNYKKDPHLKIKKTLTPWKGFDKSNASVQLLLPHVHFTLVTLLILVLNSHIQIVLRFASPGSIPAVWWGASYLILQHHDGKRRSTHWATPFILPYLVLWNVTSVVLYAGFYPPA